MFGLLAGVFPGSPHSPLFKEGRAGAAGGWAGCGKGNQKANKGRQGLANVGASKLQQGQEGNARGGGKSKTGARTVGMQGNEQPDNNSTLHQCM